MNCKLQKYRAHSIQPKVPEIPVQNRIEQKVSGNLSRKFQSTSRGCPFFWKFGNSRNFLFHLAFLPGMISALVPIVVNFASTKATRWWGVIHYVTGCKMDQNDLPQFEPVLDCLFPTKTLAGLEIATNFVAKRMRLPFSPWRLKLLFSRQFGDLNFM